MMTNVYPEEESYRVVLYSTGGHTEMEKAHFCKEVSDHYGIPLSLMKKIVDRCPIVIKKDLPFKKAKLLAIAFKSFGASVSVEKKKNLLPIFLEFATEKNWRVELESSHLRKTSGGAWQIFGRVKNRFNEELSDIWTLIQLFDEFGDLIAFEEISLPVNPLPQNESSPFRAIFEGNLPIQKISVSFKTASGNPLPARDNREKKEWIEVKVPELEKVISFLPTPFKPEAAPPPSIAPSSVITEREEQPLVEEEAEQITEEIQLVEQEKLPSWAAEEIGPGFEKIPLDRPGEDEPPKEPVKLESLQEVVETSAIDWPLIEKEEEIHAEEELHLDDRMDEPSEEKSGWVDPGLSRSEEVDYPLVSRPAPLEEKKIEEVIPCVWMEEFRKAIVAYEQMEQNPFKVWFEHLQRENGFESAYHSILTLLIYTRFNQTHPSDTALENTRKVFKVALQWDLPSEEIPPLEGALFFPGEAWRDLYIRANPKLQEVSHRILEKREWELSDLDRLIRIIPHMTARNSRWAIRFMHDQIPEVIVDISRMDIDVSESVYRVASRLGVVNPLFDYYQGKNSMGDLKIQSFARSAFPDDPGKVEEPMSRLGAGDERGVCYPTEPRCHHCLFESFCQKLFTGFNPSEKGMVFRS